MSGNGAYTFCMYVVLKRKLLSTKKKSEEAISKSVYSIMLSFKCDAHYFKCFQMVQHTFVLISLMYVCQILRKVN